MDRSPPGSPVHRILQAKILEGLPFPFPGDLPNPGIKPESLMSPALAGKFFTTSATWEAHLGNRIWSPPRSGSVCASSLISHLCLPLFLLLLHWTLQSSGSHIQVASRPLPLLTLLAPRNLFSSPQPLHVGDSYANVKTQFTYHLLQEAFPEALSPLHPMNFPSASTVPCFWLCLLASCNIL